MKLKFESEKDDLRASLHAVQEQMKQKESEHGELAAAKQGFYYSKHQNLSFKYVVMYLLDLRDALQNAKGDYEKKCEKYEQLKTQLEGDLDLSKKEAAHLSAQLSALQVLYRALFNLCVLHFNWLLQSALSVTMSSPEESLSEDGPSEDSMEKSHTPGKLVPLSFFFFFFILN